VNAPAVRKAEIRDREAIRQVEERAFGQPGEADLVERLVADGDSVLELVAEIDGVIVGHVLFSRLGIVSGSDETFPAVALAPVAVEPDTQGTGVGSALIREAHARLEASGESLSVVLGEPDYYARFGYSQQSAVGYECEYQGPYLQALAWRDAPSTGRLVYASAFGAL
jgi:putative acetyltransferase